MSVPVDRLMSQAVIVASSEDTVGEVRDRMSAHDISAIPILDPHGVLVGIVTADDMVESYARTLPVARIMTAPVHTLPLGSDARQAAALMRQRRQHHLVVTDGARVAGIVSALDLLRLIEEPSLPTSS